MRTLTKEVKDKIHNYAMDMLYSNVEEGVRIPLDMITIQVKRLEDAWVAEEFNLPEDIQ